MKTIFHPPKNENNFSPYSSQTVFIMLKWIKYATEQLPTKPDHFKALSSYNSARNHGYHWIVELWNWNCGIVELNCGIIELRNELWLNVRAAILFLLTINQLLSSRNNVGTFIKLRQQLQSTQTCYNLSHSKLLQSCDVIFDRDMVWKLGKLQSAYNELRFDVGTVLTVHKSFVFRLLIFKMSMKWEKSLSVFLF